MNIQLEIWQLISLLLVFFSATFAAGKMLVSENQRYLNTRFEAQEKTEASNHILLEKRLERIEQTHQDEVTEWRRIERELSSLKAELPLNYVRREDYARGQTVIEAKLDAIYSKFFEATQTKGANNG